MPHTPGVIWQFFHFFWGTIAHPRVTFDLSASERTMRWALLAAALPVLQVWGNVALFSALTGTSIFSTRRIKLQSELFGL
jgi:hypothetical protein